MQKARRKMKCSDCKWFESLPSGRGYCRRFPPTALANKDGAVISSAHPLVWGGDYCGEFSEKETPDAP